jgi:hypothetical protein
MLQDFREKSHPRGNARETKMQVPGLFPAMMLPLPEGTMLTEGCACDLNSCPSALRDLYPVTFWSDDDPRAPLFARRIRKSRMPSSARRLPAHLRVTLRGPWHQPVRCRIEGKRVGCKQKPASRGDRKTDSSAEKREVMPSRRNRSAWPADIFSSSSDGRPKYL